MGCVLVATHSSTGSSRKLVTETHYFLGKIPSVPVFVMQHDGAMAQCTIGLAGYIVCCCLHCVLQCEFILIFEDHPGLMKMKPEHLPVKVIKPSGRVRYV